MKSEVLTEIKKHLSEAAKAASNSNRYVKKAKRLAQKNRTPIPKELKRKFCNYCNTYWHVGKNVRVRTQRGKVVYYCLECKHYRRFPYIREQKVKRNNKK